MAGFWRTIGVERLSVALDWCEERGLLDSKPDITQPTECVYLKRVPDDMMEIIKQRIPHVMIEVQNGNRRSVTGWDVRPVMRRDVWVEILTMCENPVRRSREGMRKLRETGIDRLTKLVVSPSKYRMREMTLAGLRSNRPWGIRRRGTVTLMGDNCTPLGSRKRAYWRIVKDRKPATYSCRRLTSDAIPAPDAAHEQRREHWDGIRCLLERGHDGACMSRATTGLRTTKAIRRRHEQLANMPASE